MENDQYGADNQAAQTTTEVNWITKTSVEFHSPLIWRGPYVECKLEHPALEPTCLGDQFFPDSVPYQADSENRVFYWRSRFPDSLSTMDSWTGVCATTHELAPLTHGAVHRPMLFQSCDGGDEVVVDGTIVGDSKTAFVSEYSLPSIELCHVTNDCVELTIEGERWLVDVGSRERIDLPERTVQTSDGTVVSTSAELLIRFPGRRTVYHPAPGGDYCLFPSFGLEIGEIPRPLAVPTTAGELDHTALATELGIDISRRPYPERILWQAFAYSAFDPNTPEAATLTQFPSGRFAVQNAAL